MYNTIPISNDISSDSMTTLHPVLADDFSTMDDDALAAAVCTLAAHIHAATWRLLALIAELDRREVWAAQGALSCAHWLSWACGIDTHTAREKVRVTTRAAEPRPRVPLPRLHRHPSPARPSRQALGRRRGDLARQPYPPLSDPSPAGARGRIRRAAPRRRRVPVHQPARVGHQTTEAASDIFARHHHRPERIPRTRHRLRDRDCTLARGAYRLRPCVDGDDGVMGFGRHCPRGGTGGRRLESVVGDDRRSRAESTSCRVRARSGQWTFERRCVTTASEVRPRT